MRLRSLSPSEFDLDEDHARRDVEAALQKFTELGSCARRENGDTPDVPVS